MFYFLLALVAITPVLYMPGLGGFEALKSASLLILGSSYIALYVWRLIHVRQPIHRVTAAAIALFLALYAGVRTFLVAAPNTGWLGSELSNFGAIHWIVWWALLAAVITTNFTKKERQLVTLAVMVSMTGVLLVIAAQKTGLEGIDWLRFDDPSRGRDLIGSIGSSGQVGAIVAVMIFITQPLIKFWKARQNYGGVLAWSLVILLAIGTVLASRSISGMLLVLFGLILLAFEQWHPLSAKQWQATFWCIILLPIVAAVVPLPQSIQDRVPSWSDRTQIWHTGLQGVRHRPIFGYGIEQFPDLYDTYATTPRRDNRIVTEENPHGMIIEILSEWGLVGAVTVGWLVWSLARSTRIRRPYLPSAAVLLLAFQTNVATVSLFLLAIVVVIQLLRTATDPPATQPVAWISWSGFAGSVVLFLLSLLIGSGAVLNSYANDQGSYHNEQGLFMRAADAFASPIHWAFPRLFTQLEYVEAYTNLQIKYNDFSDPKPVISSIGRIMRQAPTSRNLIIGARITAIWRQKNSDPTLDTLFAELTQKISDSWGSNPRFKTVIAAFKRADFGALPK